MSDRELGGLPAIYPCSWVQTGGHRGHGLGWKAHVFSSPLHPVSSGSCPPLSPRPLPQGPHPLALAASNINRLLSSLPAIQGPAKLGTGIKIV